MDTIVVGNGPIVKQADFIDFHKTVVRINWLRHLEDQDNRGEKVNVWAFTGRKKDIVEEMNKFKIERIWYFHPELGNISHDFLAKHWNNVGKQPTTGYLAVMKAIEEFGFCNIIGFDFFNIMRDYWEKSPRMIIKNGHDPSAERHLLMNNARVRICS